ncbi:PTS sugar transporter subunit IIC [Clostridium hydrogeniformans]|uniref:PTS sugar transporter subunit IIC n=1 Tax=Clostridium hydrogeniformans TaxID=349933 RepID=UPI0004846E95|nr:PTS sugar transporter subunit IIC [Clostridium hydrogeniformans]
MNKLIDFLEKHLVPIASKFGSQRHLVAIRDGFVAIMPLILIGSLGIMLNQFQFPGYQDLMKSIFGAAADGSPYFHSFGGTLWNGTFGVMSLVLCIALSYNLAKSYNSDSLAAALISFASLIIVYENATFFSFAGTTGLFVAILVAIVSTELFVKLLGNKKLVIKMPDSVPPAVSRSFASLLPAVIVISLFAILKCVLVTVGRPSLHQVVYDVIQAPLQGLAQGLGSAIIVALIIHVLWFFGLHGPNIILPITSALYTPAMEENMKLVQAGGNATNIITSSFFDNFVYLGGSGATLGLLIAIFIASRRRKSALMEQYGAVSKVAFGPGLFNINEPVVFGMPIVLNVRLLIPFLITPIILVLTTYFAMSSGLVPLTYIQTHWTIPPIIGGALATNSIAGGILAAVNLLISIVIYLPFAFMGHDEKVTADGSVSR